jgi:F0F1-type ATP synthase assembly protein I
MLNIVATSLLDDPIVSFALGLIVVLVIGFVLRGFLAKKK